MIDEEGRADADAHSPRSYGTVSALGLDSSSVVDGLTEGLDGGCLSSGTPAAGFAGGGVASGASAMHTVSRRTRARVRESPRTKGSAPRRTSAVVVVGVVVVVAVPTCQRVDTAPPPARHANAIPSMRPLRAHARAVALRLACSGRRPHAQTPASQRPQPPPCPSAARVRNKTCFTAPRVIAALSARRKLRLAPHVPATK